MIAGRGLAWGIKVLRLGAGEAPDTPAVIASELNPEKGPVLTSRARAL